MKRPVYLFAALLCLLISCTSEQPDLLRFLHTAQLPSQIITIDMTADTTVVMKEGTHIFIPKGAIKGRKQKVQLEIKEALTPEQMLIAGLVTQNDGHPLSSGGMFYIDAAKGEDATIVQPLKISVPANRLEKGMQLYKGKETKEGINWTNPEPILIRDTLLLKGKQLFAANCASCHDPLKHATGPILYGSFERWGSKEEVYRFTRNAAKMIAQEHPYATCIYEKWNKTAMTAFPALTNTELDAIFHYAYQDARDKLGTDTAQYLAGSREECLKNKSRIEALLKQRSQLQSSRKTFLNPTQVAQRGAIPDRVVNGRPVNTPVAAKEPARKYVQVADDAAAYYNVEIKTFGWYNIDMMLKDRNGTRESELVVSLQGTYSKTMQVLLVIPAYKVMLRGGLLEDGISYGFYETNGKLPLPQGVKGYVIALGEAKDKEQLYIGTTEFITSLAQQVRITVATTDSAGMKATLTGLHFEQMSIQVTRDTAEVTLSKVEAELKTLGKEVNSCDCHFRRKGLSNDSMVDESAADQ